jgi:hypothetical protein
MIASEVLGHLKVYLLLIIRTFCQMTRRQAGSGAALAKRRSCLCGFVWSKMGAGKMIDSA